MIFPKNTILPCVTITPYHILESIGMPGYQDGLNQLSNASSTAFPSANMALFYPFSVHDTFSFTTLFCVNGTTATGNVDIGIYSSDGTKIISTGSIAQSGTSVLQLFTVSATELTPGQYYLALATNSGSSTFISRGINNSNFFKPLGCAQMASAFPLPATATFAAFAQNYQPIFGLSLASTI